MSETNRDELIVQYLDGLLSPDQHARVAARLLTDKEWQQAYERLNLAMASVHYYGIRQEVAAVHQQFLQQHSKQQSRAGLVRTLRIVTAAAAIILFFFISFKGYQFYMLSSDKVYEELYVSYQVPVTRAAEPALFTPISAAFARKDYRSVDSLRKKIKNLTPDDQLLTGIAALEKQDFSRAIKQLQPLDSAGNAVQEDAQFYLTLAWIKNGDYDLAIEMMERIHDNPAHAYHKLVSSGEIRDVQMLKWK
jgi:hypothetical protein